MAFRTGGSDVCQLDNRSIAFIYALRLVSAPSVPHINKQIIIITTIISIIIIIIIKRLGVIRVWYRIVSFLLTSKENLVKQICRWAIAHCSKKELLTAMHHLQEIRFPQPSHSAGQYYRVSQS